MDKKILKQNNGYSVADLVVAMLILIMFTGVIGSLYYQIVLNNSLVQMNALAVYYAVKVAEEVDKVSYNEVDSTFQNYIKSNYNIPESFNILINVENYNKDNTSIKDILKTVTIKVEYTCLNTTRNYELKKLKVKEI